MSGQSLEAGLFLPGLSLCRRELVRFIRQRNRVIGALATPIVFWLLIGGGMGRSLQFAGAEPESYIRYFFPGTLTMILLFTAIFSTISIIEDRREGFLQSVLVSPAPRSAVVLGKVLGGTLLATGQGLLFLLLAPLAGIPMGAMNYLLALVTMLIVSFGLTALGFCLAWRMNSTQGFHAIMNLFLMPMWFLSGALFPPSGAWVGLQWVMWANPLTYGVIGLRKSLDSATAAGPGLGVCLAVSAGFGLVLYLLAGRVARRTIAGDLH
jgi:ABC-2 type transport system permease protein